MHLAVGFSSPRMKVRTSAAAVPGATSWIATRMPDVVFASASLSAAGRRAGEVTIRYSSPQLGTAAAVALVLARATVR